MLIKSSSSVREGMVGSASTNIVLGFLMVIY